MIDLDAMDAAIAESERRNMFTAPIVKDLIAELREAREARHITNEQLAQAWDESRDSERAAVVAWLRKEAVSHRRDGFPIAAYTMQERADAIERGEHRREVTDAHR